MDTIVLYVMPHTGVSIHIRITKYNAKTSARCSLECVLFFVQSRSENEQSSLYIRQIFNTKVE